MDSTLGVDYFGKILGKGRSKVAVDSIFQGEILKEKDVLQITKFNSSIVGTSYSLDFVVRTANGAVVAIPTINIII